MAFLVMLERTLGQFAWVGSVSPHLFTFGVMGLIIPAMLIRIVLPQAFPSNYAIWIQLAVACWYLCFVTIGWRYVPFLLLPRVDGKEH